jgi:hypothetical protein
MWRNPPDEEIAGLLASVQRIAVVGLSDKPWRDSNSVSRYMLEQGYGIVPVNPAIGQFHGARAYASLRDVPGKVDLVNVFRSPEHVPGVVEDAIAIGAPALWLQDGVVDEASAQKAKDAGMVVVMDDCIMRKHRWLTTKR